MRIQLISHVLSWNTARPLLCLTYITDLPNNSNSSIPLYTTYDRDYISCASLKQSEFMLSILRNS